MGRKKELIDISHLIRKKDTAEVLYSVWYDVSTGAVTEVSPHVEGTTGHFIEGKGPIYKDLVSGEKPFNRFLVIYNTATGQRELTYKEEYIKKAGAGKYELQPVEFSAETDSTTQFTLVFYKDIGKCELLINHDSFTTMFQNVTEEQLEINHNDYVTFFIRDKDTGYLIGKHKFFVDMQHDMIMEDDASWLNDYDVDHVEVLSHKNFCTYKWTMQEVKIDRVVKVNRTRVIPSLRGVDNAHIFIVYDGKSILFKSNIKDPSNYSIHDNLKLWITRREHPDVLYGNITVPIESLANKGTFRLHGQSNLNIEELDFLSNNQYIRIAIKEDYEGTNK